MVVVDARDKPINIGYQVRYVNTGTIGEVIELKLEDDVGWVRLDKTGLWYVSNLLEVLDEKDLKQKRIYGEDKEVDIDAIKDNALDLENIELNSNVAEGGG
ncbi:MAG: DUF2098 domain-containing protein [Methanobrevibacter sp.]|uniref:DUF2098 domain-containing protein n=1 Tax=Methanobrevibacter sp. TaxID=66852 RepID=UPI0026E0A29A|nr:DUF2098 domain-containing protein [Methanobrevibacter sp.]MDO5848305.1 DUF2098 domain-containing protein [Methanobrevibacter sp.]